MKIKNLKLDKDTAGLIFYSTLLLGSIVGTPVYFLYESKKQVCEEYSTINDSDIFINNDGNYCKNFDVGEHVIRISRNDGSYHYYDEIEGYTIKNVEINGWRHNSKAIYVNTLPVTAIGKNNSDGYLVFDDFGTVQEKIKTK